MESVDLGADLKEEEKSGQMKVRYYEFVCFD